MVGSSGDVNQGTTVGGDERACRGQSVRSSWEAGNDRGAKGLEESGCVMNQNHDSKPAPVAAAPRQAGEAPARREPWWWVERGVWTERMLTQAHLG